MSIESETVTGYAWSQTQLRGIHTLQRDDATHVKDVDGLGGG